MIDTLRNLKEGNEYIITTKILKSNKLFLQKIFYTDFDFPNDILLKFIDLNFNKTHLLYPEDIIQIQYL